jgi:arginase family enzyme
LRALELAEYNPRRDRDGLTAQLICDLIEDMLPQLARALRRAGARDA